MYALLFGLPPFFLVLAAPMSIMYLLLGYMVFNGVVSRKFIDAFRLTIGTVHVYPLDFLFACAVLLVPFYFVAKMFGARYPPKVSRYARFAAVLVSVYLVFHLGRVVQGYLDGVPPEALVRLFSADGQVVYFFLPFLYARNELQFARVLKFLVLIALLFPFGQLFLAGSEDTAMLLKGQETLRLGFGDSSIFAAVALFAMLTWEWKPPLAVLPAASIVMLAHRSAYIGTVIGVMTMSLLKGRSLKTMLVMGVGGALALGLLYGAQMLTSEKVYEKGIERIGQTFENTGTTRARLQVIPQVLEVWEEHPVFGLGYKNIYDLRLHEDVSARAFNLLHPHNFVLAAMGQTGIVGTVLLLWIIVYVLTGTWRLARTGRYRLEGAFLFGSLLFFVLFSLMNMAMGTAGFFFWMLVGTTFWYLNQARLHAIEQRQ